MGRGKSRLCLHQELQQKYIPIYKISLTKISLTVGIYKYSMHTQRHCSAQVRACSYQSVQNPFEITCMRCGETIIKWESQGEYLYNENIVRAST